MLVMSRKKGEALVINDDIIVEVIEIRGDKVRLGIISPPNMPVHRREVYDAIRRYEPDFPSAMPLSPPQQGPRE